MMDNAINLYLDLLKKSVGNFIYDDDLDLVKGKYSLNEETGKYYSSDAPLSDYASKYQGHIWPSRAHTMIGMHRLNNIQHCAEEVIKSGISGDFIETGVWRGGATIFMRGILKAYGITDRLVWVADSFEGFPQSNFELYPKESPDKFYYMGDIVVSLEEVKKNFERYELLDEQVRFLKGWFQDTLPNAPINKLSIMRLDGDMYESTIVALKNLYDKLSPGGFIIIDDYNAHKSCNEAVDDFRKERNITTELSLISGSGAFWRKES